MDINARFDPPVTRVEGIRADPSRIAGERFHAEKDLLGSHQKMGYASDREIFLSRGFVSLRRCMLWETASKWVCITTKKRKKKLSLNTQGAVWNKQGRDWAEAHRI